MEGEGELPEVGKPFQLTGPGLEFGTRWVTTSPVVVWVHVEGSNEYDIQTRSGSVYLVEVL